MKKLFLHRGYVLVVKNRKIDKIKKLNLQPKTQQSKNEDHGIWAHRFMTNRWGNSGNSKRLYFGGLQKSLQMVIAAMKLKDACSLEEKL